MSQRAALTFGALPHGITGCLRLQQVFQCRGEPSILPFACRAPSALASNALRCAVRQTRGEFALATRDGVAVQPRDLGKPLHSAVTLAGGLNGGKPATLLLIQAADQQVDLPMQQLIGMGLA